MKKVYIAHPLRGDIEANMKKADDICKRLSGHGCIIPFSPLHAFGFLSAQGDQSIAMKYCFALLASCNELWVHGNWRQSEGCLMEIEFAKQRGMTIRYISDCGVVINHE